jgi:hypothetical protein
VTFRIANARAAALRWVEVSKFYRSRGDLRRAGQMVQPPLGLDFCRFFATHCRNSAANSHQVSYFWNNLKQEMDDSVAAKMIDTITRYY